MIKAAVRLQSQKMGGIVAVIAFGVRYLMEARFANGGYIVMTFATVTKYVDMIDEGDRGKSESRVASLA